MTASAVPSDPSTKRPISSSRGKADLEVTFCLCQFVDLSILNLLHENVRMGGKSRSTVERCARCLLLQ